MTAPLWLWEEAILCAELWTACRKRLSSLIGDCWNVFISGIESVDGELFGRCVAIATSWLGYWNGWTLPEKINRIKDIFSVFLIAPKDYVTKYRKNKSRQNESKEVFLNY